MITLTHTQTHTHTLYRYIDRYIDVYIYIYIYIVEEITKESLTSVVLFILFNISQASRPLLQNEAESLNKIKNIESTDDRQRPRKQIKTHIYIII